MSSKTSIADTHSFKGYEGLFAKRLREEMHAQKITQEALARQTGLARQTISQYMDGSVLPNVERLYNICNYFDVSGDYLIGLTNSKREYTTDQPIQDTLKLSDGELRFFKGLTQGRSNELFPLPYNREALDYMLSDKDLIWDLLNLLFNCWGKMDTDESDYATYMLMRFVDKQLINKGYYDFYKPTVLNRKARQKPGRKRKEQTTNINNQEEEY